MPRYRKKPVVVEARQFDGTNGREIEAWADSWVEGSVRVVSEMHAPIVLAIYTLEGVMKANAGDWIIKGVNGEFYPCRNDIFQATYEEVSDGSQT